MHKAYIYFTGFELKIQVADDSHYAIQFSSQAECLRAMSAKNKEGRHFSSPHEIIQVSTLGWIELMPYYEISFERKLMARFLTNLDEFPLNKNRA